MNAKTNTSRRRGIKKHIHRHAKMALVPHGANQYRPHLIRRTGLAMIMGAVVSLQLLYSLSMGGAVLGVTQPITTRELLSETNRQRAEHGASPLVLDDRLSEAAYMKGQDMLKQQYWAHTAPNGVTPWHWFGAVGYDYAYAGENLAKGFASSGAVMAAWMASSEHRENVLNPRYTQVGLAVVNGTLDGKETSLVVALYGQPLVQGVAAVAKATDAPVATEPIALSTRLAIIARSLTPPALMALILLTLASGVATVAHVYRNRLPKKLRRSWYRHHGAYKLAGFAVMAVAIVGWYGGGQI